MFNTYDDITSQIAAPPIWFDEYSVPRYCPFSPDRSVSIYIREIALIEIACQSCGRIFKVAISAANFGGQTIADVMLPPSCNWVMTTAATRSREL